MHANSNCLTWFNNTSEKWTQAAGNQENISSPTPLSLPVERRLGTLKGTPPKKKVFIRALPKWKRFYGRRFLKHWEPLEGIYKDLAQNRAGGNLLTKIGDIPHLGFNHSLHFIAIIFSTGTFRYIQCARGKCAWCPWKERPLSSWIHAGLEISNTQFVE